MSMHRFTLYEETTQSLLVILPVSALASVTVSVSVSVTVSVSVSVSEGPQ